MTLKFTCTLFIFSFFLPLSLCAQNMLIVSLINYSVHAFVFERARVEFPNNTLSIDREVLLPGGTATVYGTTTYDEDLSGVLNFKNNANFWIVDKRQFHIGPPIFSFVSNYTRAKVISRTQNPSRGARLLSYTAAKVVIESLFPDRHR